MRLVEFFCEIKKARHWVNPEYVYDVLEKWEAEEGVFYTEINTADGFLRTRERAEVVVEKLSPLVEGWCGGPR